MRTTTIFSLVAGLILAGAPAFGEGLDELSQNNPENAPAAAEGEAAEGDAAEETQPAQATTPPIVQSAASKAIADKLFLQTSFGWVKASKKEGEWDGSGMSDLTVGYKLAPVGLFRAMFRRPFEQWAPFAVTVLAILFTDLLKGVGIGMLVGVGFILHRNLKVAYFIHHREAHATDGSSQIRIELSENVSFLNKASVSKVLHELPPNSSVTIDGPGSHSSGSKRASAFAAMMRRVYLSPAIATCTSSSVER